MKYKPGAVDDRFANYAIQMILSTGDIYRQYTTPYNMMLAKHLARGPLDRDLAIKGYITYVIEPTLNQIKRDFNEYMEGELYAGRISQDTKKVIARELLDEYEETVKDYARDILARRH